MCPPILISEERESAVSTSGATGGPGGYECLNDRLSELACEAIDYIDNVEFRNRDAAETILDAPVLQELNEPTARGDRANGIRDMPRNLERLCRAPLLTQPQEAALFRRMNFLKYRAERLLMEIDHEQPDARMLERIEADLADAKATRDQIIERNIRLVVSVVKKFVTPQISFDEMLSDGIVTLMGTVEKFDYGRGYRFSTYAYRSIARAASRTVKTSHREKQRYSDRCENELVDETSGVTSEEASDQLRWEQERSLVSQLIERLEPREQVIVSERFALGDETKVQTLRAIAQKLGISKERVRQLEQKALAKLQQLAQALFPNAAVEATIV